MTASNTLADVCLNGHPLHHYERYSIVCTCEVCINPITAHGVGCRRCNFDLCESCYSLYMSNVIVRDVLRAASSSNDSNNSNSNNNNYYSYHSHHSTSVTTPESHNHVRDAVTSTTKSEKQSIYSATSFNFRNCLSLVGGRFSMNNINSNDASNNVDNNNTKNTNND